MTTTPTDAERPWLADLKKSITDHEWYSNSPRRDWLPCLQEAIRQLDARDATIATLCQERDEARAALTESKAEVARLQDVCSEAYQVVGALAHYGGWFDTDDVTKALDNLSAASDGEPIPHTICCRSRSKRSIPPQPRGGIGPVQATRFGRPFCATGARNTSSPGGFLP